MLTNKEIKLSQNICVEQKPEQDCHKLNRSACQPWNIATMVHIWELRMRTETVGMSENDGRKCNDRERAQRRRRQKVRGNSEAKIANK